MTEICRVGIDVGGTNTDAVVMVGTDVLAAYKAATTEDVLGGIGTAITGVLERARICTSDIRAVMVGTTHFINALVRKAHLSKVFVVRLCGPSSRALPPFIDFPGHMQAATGGDFLFLNGGFEYDGRSEISQVVADEVKQAAQKVVEGSYHSVVVSGIFSVVNPSQEKAVVDMLHSEIKALAPGHSVFITPSHQCGQLGLLERENTAILNAVLQPEAARALPAYAAALEELGISAPLLLTANDGTLISLQAAQQMPVLTLQSGPVNSVRGAAFLSGLNDAVVIDIGGTTTDVGVVTKGAPRAACLSPTICSIRTNFRMPDVMSIGLGGGSLVQCVEVGVEASEVIDCKIGPQSVGEKLLERSLVCGGDVLTATDVAVLIGKMPFGDPGRVSQPPTDDQLAAAWQVMQHRLYEVVDAMKLSRGEVPVVVVGGAAALCGDDLPGASKVVRPAYGDVANAIGAAIPQVGGIVEGVYDLRAGREGVLKQLEERARVQAVRNGAQESSCQVKDIEEVQLGYLPGNVARIRVQVVGDLDLNTIHPRAAAVPALRSGLSSHAQSPAMTGSCNEVGALAGTAADTASASICQPAGSDASMVLQSTSSGWPGGAGQPQGEGEGSSELKDRNADVEVGAKWMGKKHQGDAVAEGLVMPSGVVAAFGGQEGDAEQEREAARQLVTEHPNVDASGHWVLTPAGVEAMALGAAVLGCGGGGSPHLGKLRLLAEMKRGNAARVVSLDSLPDDTLLSDCGGMGAPTVGVEKLDAFECQAAVEGLMSVVDGRGTITALLCTEAGGGNCLEPLVIAARMGLVVPDADLMGRAFPELQMCTSSIYGVPLTPAAMADEKGNVVVMTSSSSAAAVEKVLRGACTELGCSVGLSASLMTAKTAKKVAVKGSLSLAWRLGAAVLKARLQKEDPVAAIVDEYKGGKVLFSGKVVDVQRSTMGGFVKGHLVVEALGVEGHKGANLQVEFQNENLVAREDGAVVACVPDLICCLETSTGHALGTEEVRYGARITVVVLPAHLLLRTPEALAVVGPAAFGYNHVEYNPVGEFHEHTPPYMAVQTV